MSPFFRPIAILLVAGVLLLGGATAQSPPAAAVPAHRTAVAESAIKVRNISIQQTDEGVALTISSNGALVPAITQLDGPPRLVIDLAGAVNTTPRARMKGTGGDIKTVRVSQYQQDPPLTRVVVDLSEPQEYAWETAPNKLIVHLRRAEESSHSAKSSPPAFTAGVEPAITYAGAPAMGSVHEVDQQTSGPSSVSASEGTTVLNLARGGQIRVCPGTTISVTSSGDQRDLMVGMSTGSFEMHYALSDSADSVLTPDFRILLPGPGQFNLAISADSRGNTCVRSLPGNMASAVVSELMGDGTYEVKANESVVFHDGQVAKAAHQVPTDCGCPAAQTPVLRTEAPPPPPPTETAPQSEDKTHVGDQIAVLAPGPGPGVAVKMSVTAPDASVKPVFKPGDTHMEVDAPLVFRGNEEPLPAPTEEAQKLPVMSARPRGLAIIPLPPPAVASRPNKPPSTSHPGFFGHIKRFFSSVFG